MNRRKLLIGLTIAGLFTAGFGSSVVPASAEPRTLLVTLLGGSQVTVTVDVPPGTPLDQIAIPGITRPVVDVQEVPAPVPPAEGAEPTAPTEPPAPTTPAAPEADEPKAGKQEGQATTGTGTRKPRKAAKAAPQAPDEAGSEATAEGRATDRATDEAARAREETERLRGPDGAPQPSNPGYSLALPGPARLGVPNFFIDKFRIPPFLLSIYQAAGIEYGVRWELLAAINEIETDYGRNLNVSSAGALGWMQFMPASWKAYGVDANRDGRKDPYNPVDAIFAAARYLKAARVDQDVRAAVFAYNHADWYVDSVLMRARLISGLPADLVGSLTGLTQGHFPVHAKARYADDLRERDVRRRIEPGRNAAMPVESHASRRGINVFAKRGSPVVAVQDGRIVKIGRTKRLGRFVQLRDAYGNTYTYAHLKKLARAHPVPKRRTVSREQVARELKLPERDPRPTAPASAGRQAKRAERGTARRTRPRARSGARPAMAKERLFANPGRPAALKAGGEEQLLEAGTEVPGAKGLKSYFTKSFKLDRDEFELKRLRPGSKVIAGTILGRIGRTQGRTAPHVLFEIRPAGRGAPRIDPKPVLDGWKLLESTAIYRAAGKNPFYGPDAKHPSIGQVLLMSKEALQRRVLTNPRIDVYECGRRDIRAGGIDRRILASLEFLAASGLRPTVTSLHCGHGYYTASGNVSHHSSGNAVDIAAVNGIPILGHQGEGSITDLTIRRLLTLQGTMKPAQIISLMTFEGTDNTYAMGDHADHIHLGFQPLFGTNPKLGRQLNGVLKPGQWNKLIRRLGAIDNPTVPTEPSKYAIEGG